MEERQDYSIVSRHYCQQMFYVGKIQRYIEPFLGGASVFTDLFDIFAQSVEKFYINDSNYDLMDMYYIVAIQPTAVIEHLDVLQIQYNNAKDRQKWFLERRAEYNECKKNVYPGVMAHNSLYYRIRKTALFIAINKTCFNGLYRLNSKGELNVSNGTLSDKQLFIPEDIEQLSAMLWESKLDSIDFMETFQYITPRSFIFLDPPYLPITNKSKTNYGFNNFDELDHKRVALYFRKADRLGAKVILCSSDVPIIRELYHDYDIFPCKIFRSSGGQNESRRYITELIITNH